MVNSWSAGVERNIGFLCTVYVPPRLRVNMLYNYRKAMTTTAHENEHEAELLMGLCKHLMLQGYAPEQVTVLTPYSGQFFLLRKVSDSPYSLSGWVFLFMKGKLQPLLLILDSFSCYERYVGQR